MPDLLLEAQCTPDATSGLLLSVYAAVCPYCLALSQCLRALLKLVLFSCSAADEAAKAIGDLCDPVQGSVTVTGSIDHPFNRLLKLLLSRCNSTGGYSPPTQSSPADPELLQPVLCLAGVCVLAATSRPDLLDAALLRPGRLDRLIYCGFPDASERGHILQALARRLSLHATVDLQQAGRQCEGCSGADLSALLSEAQLAAVHEKLDLDAAGVSLLILWVGDLAEHMFAVLFFVPVIELLSRCSPVQFS